MNKTSFSLCLFLIFCQYTYAQLITYSAPKGSILNPDYTVKVREAGKQWQSVHSYPAKVAEVVNNKNIIQTTSFAYFDFSGKVEVSVTYNKGPVKEVKIRPSSHGIVKSVKGNTITFSLTEPRNLSVEVNGDIFHNLQLFANPLETTKPLPSDTSVVYYGPGIHYIGDLKIPSNKTVYIAGGAIVQGSLTISKAENVRILGRGILTQVAIAQIPSENPAPKTSFRRTRNDEITVEFSKNIEINGFIVIPDKYSVLVGQSKDVTISNFKSFSSGGNADGLDIFSSTNVLIDRVFMRNADDCIAIYGHRWAYYGDVKNLTVQNSVLWADVAHPIQIGTHGNSKNPETLGNMKFTNIDVLDQYENQLDYQGCLSLNAGDSNLIRDISFNDIRVENIRKGQLVNMRVMFNRKYNTSAGRGIENIYFKDISYTGNQANLSVITGYDETRGIRNITFDNLIINGKVIADNMPGKPAWYKTGDLANILIGEHVEEVKFISPTK
ncbi:MAG TPA: glycosyl hydrolase family 28 protein [Pedobacter sp.]|uniref:glycosyl hydrolase family 28 protein n=1 Tax=Pedobacter sp. TaxID=1411316 RepID=UPI002BA7DBD2|nr:glycosyl hydrolase family 28 protein [Pedobacter sp.]HMI02816.1 glycosyl hydrolase family 28 protein [Pedobacter sp.]